MKRTGLDNGTLVSKALPGPNELVKEMIKVATTEIAYLNALEVPPYPFIRIEIRSVPWQLLQMQSFGNSYFEKGLDLRAAMDR